MKRITVLLEIEVPEGDFCWDGITGCGFYDCEDGISSCEFNLSYDLGNYAVGLTVEKPPRCKQLLRKGWLFKKMRKDQLLEQAEKSIKILEQAAAK